MPENPLRIALIYGGRSAEHEVSLRSALSIFRAMDRTRYDVTPILISRSGSWYVMPVDDASFDASANPREQDRVLLSHDPAHPGLFFVASGRDRAVPAIDVAFPALHGPYGEDGTLQGLFELADTAYVGCGVLGSSVGMDKVMMKHAFAAEGLEIGPFSWFLRSEWERDRSAVLGDLAGRKYPLFVKPANLGSSVGITKVADHDNIAAAIDLAASYDRKILIEDTIPGRELEVSVLGNDEPEASVPGEVVPHADFYDYEEKYIRDTAELHIPADLTEETARAAGEIAIRAFKAVDGSGLGRVDMFLTPDGRLVVNEINTLPGFTSISMYPKLWEASGLPYDKLIDRLIDLAIDRRRDKDKTRTDRTAP